MNNAKVCQQQIWGSRNYQITWYFVPTVMADVHRPVSTPKNWVYYEVKRSHQI